jgi:hypothetical protein
MPLAELVCHCHQCNGRESHPPEVVIDHARQRGNDKYTAELLRSMLAQQQNRGERISTTTLTSKCLRSEVLQRTTPYTADPDKLYAAFRGTLWHGQLEQFADSSEGAIAEARFHVIDLFGLGPFSGSPDLVDVAAGTLYDYKFNKENPRWEKAWDEHIAQVNINRWLVDHADYVEWKDEDAAVPFDYALTDAGAEYLHAFQSEVRPNRERFVPVDWQGLYLVYMDDKGPKQILCTKSIQIPKKDGNGTKAARVADIWSDDRVEEYMHERYVRAKEALVEYVLPDPGPGFETFNHPLCGFCPVKGDCLDRYIESQVVLRGRRSSAVGVKAA